MNTLGQRLQYARDCRRYTRPDLAQYAGFTEREIEGWERGEYLVPNDAVRILAYYLQVPVAWLLGEQEEVPCRPLTVGELFVAKLVDVHPSKRLARLRQERPRMVGMPKLD